MKIRNSHVTNSSSVSYIIALKKDTEYYEDNKFARRAFEKFMELIEDNENFSTLGTEEVVDSYYGWEINNASDQDRWKEKYNKILKYINEGNVVYKGSFDNWMYGKVELIALFDGEPGIIIEKENA